MKEACWWRRREWNWLFQSGLSAAVGQEGSKLGEPTGRANWERKQRELQLGFSHTSAAICQEVMVEDELVCETLKSVPSDLEVRPPRP